MRSSLYLGLFHLAFGLYAVCPEVPAPVQSDLVADVVAREQARKSALKCQIEEMREARRRVIESFRAHVMQEGRLLKGDEQAELAKTTGYVTRVQALVKAYEKQMGTLLPLVSAYAAQTAQKLAPLTAKNNEVIDRIQKSLPTLPLQEMAKTKAELTRLFNQESLELAALIEPCQGQLLEVERVETQFQAEFDPLKTFLWEHQLAVPVLSGPYRNLLTKLRAVVERRTASLEERVLQLLSLLETRERWLLGAKIDQTTGVVLDAGRKLEASTEFLNRLKQALSEANEPFPKALGQDLAYVEENYRRRRNVLEMISLCGQPSAPEWMHLGCAVVQGERSRQEVFLSRTLAREIEKGLSTLAQDQTLQSKVELVRQHLKAGKMTEAVQAYDALLPPRRAR